jgi:glucan phosphoethanolaminetransferase (alkaline phosphatase superfamily)
MDAPSMKQPSAFLPLAMSLAALAVVLLHAAMFGTAHEADEGTGAHLFQILMVAQVPIVAFFAIKWLPWAPRQALRVLGLQAGAAIAAFASVYFLT